MAQEGYSGSTNDQPDSWAKPNLSGGAFVLRKLTEPVSGEVSGYF